MATSWDRVMAFFDALYNNVDKCEETFQKSPSWIVTSMMEEKSAERFEELLAPIINTLDKKYNLPEVDDIVFDNELPEVIDVDDYCDNLENLIAVRRFPIRKRKKRKITHKKDDEEEKMDESSDTEETVENKDEEATNENDKKQESEATEKSSTDKDTTPQQSQEKQSEVNLPPSPPSTEKQKHSDSEEQPTSSQTTPKRVAKDYTEVRKKLEQFKNKIIPSDIPDEDVDLGDISSDAITAESISKSLEKASLA